jgi:hypothetical protein
MATLATVARTMARLLVCTRTALVIHRHRETIGSCTCDPCAAYDEALQAGVLATDDAEVTETRPAIGFRPPSQA